MHTGRAQRYDGDIDTGVIQERDGSFPGPPKRRKSTDGSMIVLRRLPEEIRQQVLMRVDRQRCILS
jgi:hypothetical protein